MANKTQENIKKKRLAIARRRRVRVSRLILLLVIAGLLLSAGIFLLVNIYRWGSHLYQEYNAMYQAYNNRQETARGKVDPKFNGYTNVLVLGLDEGANPEGAKEVEADTIFLVSVENETGRLRILTIPPDTWLQGEEGGSRLSAVYGAGGAPLMVRQVSDLLSISIHQYVTLDMKTFADIIDILGGIDLYVENDMNYEDAAGNLSIHLEKGYQHLDGETAAKYLRYRGTDLGTVGRVQRQQRFIKALYEKILQLDTIPKLPAIADMFQNRMKTSAEIFDSAHLANVLRSLSSDAPLTIMLPGERSEEDLWIPNRDIINLKIRELFPVYEIKQQNEEEQT